jgi:hypothetical protein
MQRQQIRFGDVTIKSVFPTSLRSNQSSQDKSLQQDFAMLDTCFQVMVPDPIAAGEGK